MIITLPSKTPSRSIESQESIAFGAKEYDQFKSWTESMMSFVPAEELGNDEYVLDYHTAQHCRRVGSLCYRIATQTYIEKVDHINMYDARTIADLARMCGQSHDLGKAKPIIRETVNNGELLNETTRKIIQDHSIEGARMIAKGAKRLAVPEEQRVIWEIAEYTARSHHIKKDGTGYPDLHEADVFKDSLTWLTGHRLRVAEEITSIVMVADIFDALTTAKNDRKYIAARLHAEGNTTDPNSSALSGKVVLEIIEKESGENSDLLQATITAAKRSPEHEEFIADIPKTHFFPAAV